MFYNMLHRDARRSTSVPCVYVLRVKTHTYDDRNVYACGMGPVLGSDDICSGNDKG